MGVNATWMNPANVVGGTRREREIKRYKDREKVTEEMETDGEK